MKKNKVKKYETEEQLEVKKFIFVLLGLIIIIIGIYLFTRAFVTKDLFDTKNDDIVYTDGKINYDTVIVGTMLNRADSEYYVLAFGSEDTKANYYNTIASSAVTKSDKKIYFLDLSNELNKKYVANEDDEASTKYTSLAEFKFGDITLLRIKNGKITKIIINVDDIKKELGI